MYSQITHFFCVPIKFITEDITYKCNSKTYDRKAINVKIVPIQGFAIFISFQLKI